MFRQSLQLVEHNFWHVCRITCAGIVWEVKIKSGIKFSDGTPLEAQHVADSLNSQNSKNDNAQSSLGDITASISEDLTVRIETEKVTHIMDSVLAEWVFVIFTTNSDGEFVFTGPYMIEHYEMNDHMDLNPNPYYPDADKRPLVEIKKFSDGHDLAKDAIKKKVDIGFHLPIDTLPDLRSVISMRVKSFEVGYHYMAFYNTDTLPDANVRKAIDLAIDRMELSQALAGGDATRSLFPDNSPYFLDDSDSNAQQSEAETILDQAGWVLDGSKRKKDGQQLKIRLVAYPHRPGLVIMQPLIADALEDLGIEVETILTGSDWSETQTIIDDRTFDMLMWAQHTLPAGDPSWFLNAFFHSDGGNNHANYNSAAVDGLLDSLSVEDEHADRVNLSNAIQAEIHKDVPVSNLVTPVWHVSLNEDNVEDYEAYGSDYYVIRADLRAKMNGSTRMHTTLSAMVIMVGGLLLQW